jgi:hypothetical protein
MNAEKDTVSFFVLCIWVYNTEKGTGEVLLVLADSIVTVSSSNQPVDSGANNGADHHYPRGYWCNVFNHATSITLVADICNLDIVLCETVYRFHYCIG